MLFDEERGVSWALTAVIFTLAETAAGNQRRLSI